ncbi:MAG: UDP-N-acetylglucosamine--N-acetylmuramyl-(pentapeptide) pyrophosphoryl-undecaprenol N-acetylglucosamine transferase [Planctomycetota bacterium]
MTPRVVYMAGGASGGHLYPGVAVARELQELSGIETRFLCLGSALEQQIISAHGFRSIAIPELRTKSVSNVGRALRALRRLFAADAPLAVVGLGGRSSFLPAIFAAWRGVPVFLFEQNRILGKTNRWLLRWATRVMLAFDETQGPRRLRRCGIVLGCPVRREFRASDLPASDTVIELLVLGGSQGAEDLNRLLAAAVPTAPADLRARLHITHMTGAEKGGELTAAYRAANISADVTSYDEQLASRLHRAHFVVARAGGSTVAELCAVGRGALLVPYPHHRDRQQFLNADVMVAAGAACIANTRAEEFAPLLWNSIGSSRIRAEQAKRASALGKCRAARNTAFVIATHLEMLPASEASELSDAEGPLASRAACRGG